MVKLKPVAEHSSCIIPSFIVEFSFFFRFLFRIFFRRLCKAFNVVKIWLTLGSKSFLHQLSYFPTNALSFSDRIIQLAPGCNTQSSTEDILNQCHNECYICVMRRGKSMTAGSLASFC